MNFQIFKENFLEYLINQLNQTAETQNKEVADISDVSIFMYQDEFANYLENEHGIDLADIGQDLSDIENLDYSDNEFSSKKGTQTNTEDEIFLGLLNEFINNENITKQIDKNNDNSITKEETLEFLSTLEDENNNGLTLGAMFNVTGQQVKKGSTQNNRSSSYSFSFLGESISEINDKTSSILGKLLDKDADGTLSESEQDSAKDFLSLLDGNNSNLTSDDINVFKEYISSLGNLSDKEIIKHIQGLDGSELDLSINDFKSFANSANTTNTNNDTAPNNALDSSFNNSENSSSSSSSSYSNNSSSSSTQSSQKAFQNMSISELEKELSGVDTKITEAQNKYITELEKTDKDLSDKVNKTQKNITETNEKITKAQTDIDNYKTRISSIDGEIGSLQTDLEKAKAFNSSLEKGEDEDGNKITGEKIDTKSIEAQIAALESEKNDISENKIPELEAQITTHKDELTGFETELTTYEGEISKLGETHPDLQSYYAEYKEALTEKGSIQQVLAKRRADQEKSKNENYDRPDKGAGSKDYRIKDKFSYDNLPMSYTVDGKEYHCVGFEGYDLDGDGEIDFHPNSWEEVQRYFDNAGVENLGKYGSMQCHNYSDVMGQFVLGAANLDLVKELYAETNNPEYNQEDRAGYMASQSEWNKRQFARCNAPDRDSERAIIENELQNGRPCVVVVGGSEHWVLAVGIAEDGDILIWDSYDGKMEKLGQTRNDDKEKLSRNMNVKEGVLVFCEDYSYQYGTAQYFDYWEYIENGPDYIRANGYKK